MTIINNSIVLLALCICGSLFAQDNTLNGKWQLVEIQKDTMMIFNRNDINVTFHARFQNAQKTNALLNLSDSIAINKYVETIYPQMQQMFIEFSENNHLNAGVLDLENGEYYFDTKAGSYRIDSNRLFTNISGAIEHYLFEIQNDFLILRPAVGSHLNQQGYVKYQRNRSSMTDTENNVNVIDSLTTGFFTQSFAVDAPHSNALHSLAFYKNNTFDYRIMDDRHSEIDIYQGTWLYLNDSIHIAIDSNWVADYKWEPLVDSSDQIIGKSAKIDTAWSKGPLRYYTFSKDVLVYSYSRHTNGSVCFPKRYQTQNCLIKNSTSFLHELKIKTN